MEIIKIYNNGGYDITLIKFGDLVIEIGWGDMDSNTTYNLCVYVKGRIFKRHLSNRSIIRDWYYLDTKVEEAKRNLPLSNKG